MDTALASLRSSLSALLLPKAGELSIPFLEEFWLSTNPRLLEPIPRFAGSQPVNSLVRPNVVVPTAEDVELLVELLGVPSSSDPLSYSSLEGAEESFHSAVLPWRHRLGTLVADSQPEEREAEKPRGEGRAIVGPENLWSSVELDRIEQQSQDRDRAIQWQLAERQASAGPMVDHAQDRFALGGHHGQVERPNYVIKRITLLRADVVP